MPLFKQEAFLTIFPKQSLLLKRTNIQYHILSKSYKNFAHAYRIYLFRYLWAVSFYPHIKKLLNTHLRLEMKRFYGVGLHNIGYMVGYIMCYG